MTIFSLEKPSLAAQEPLPLEARIINIPPITSTIEGGLNSPVTSFAASEETVVAQEDGTSAGIVPDGGLRAWLVVLGGFLDFTIAFGLVNSFGTTIPPMSNSFSPQLFILFLGGAVVGPIFDRYGSRALMFSGTAVCLLSFICSSFAAQYYQYLLAQGILLGIGNALLFYPATGAISEWFNHKRGLALGIALSGSSVGGIFWPIIINKLFDSVPAPWVHRIIALISVPVLLISCFLVRERKATLAAVIIITDAEANLSGSSVKPTDKNRDESKAEERNQNSSGIRDAVCERRFAALCLSLFFIYGGMLIPFYYIPLFAIEHGLGATMANNLLAIGYAGSVVGRVGSGWIADRFGRFNVLFIMALLTATVTFSWASMTSSAAMTASALLFGLFSGGLIPLGSACVAQTTPADSMDRIGLRIGLMMAFASFAALSGGPASGAIKDASAASDDAAWLAVFSFSAALTLAGAGMLLGVRFWWRPFGDKAVF
ncbi:MFS general substrate transporter [Trichoderma citrinoviride]|uniref:MFS general substrate transporter n=1 Tax=Trichoderma citrinoviride TaxID=58853 RepID=A0A2T4B4F1_9HYPO|nr:MFS general substrate transporter [Trichoderma citrinoviride]PTB64207.1 MFS general substrate transporter [Trichoderma citrinoviride]